MKGRTHPAKISMASSDKLWNAKQIILIDFPILFFFFIFNFSKKFLFFSLYKLLTYHVVADEVYIINDDVINETKFFEVKDFKNLR